MLSLLLLLFRRLETTVLNKLQSQLCLSCLCVFVPKTRGLTRIFWVPKNAQTIGCQSLQGPSYLCDADMGSSSTRDGHGRAIRGPAEPRLSRERSRETCSLIRKSEENWCVWHISAWPGELVHAATASLGKSKLFSRFLQSFP